MRAIKWSFFIILLLGALVSAGVFFGARIIRDISGDLLRSVKEVRFGLTSFDSVDYGDIKIVLSYSSNGLLGDSKRRLFPLVNVLVEDFVAVVDGMRLEIDNVALSYDFIVGATSVFLPNAGGMRIAVLSGEEVRYQCNNIGAVLSFELRDNLFLYTMKRLLGIEEGLANQIVAVRYIDSSAANCVNQNTKEETPVYSSARFDFDVISNAEVKANVEVSAKGANSDFLSFSIRDMLVHQYGDDRRVDIDITQFRLWRRDFSMSLKGEVSLASECVFNSFRSCGLDFLLEVQGYQDFLKFMYEVAEGASGPEIGFDGADVRRGVDALSAAVGVAATFEEENDSMTLSVESGGDELRVGKISYDEFVKEILGALAKDIIAAELPAVVSALG
ncbi:hypothetical protein [Anaplasma phagocytophilum]|uniref:hypothetical protein n=1 Tax=Anaplasma phagocytophilum TaxID=948 RepID=UPI0012BC2CCA|nr:hypothetical protein [Anaplasma phagocytophilum]